MYLCKQFLAAKNDELLSTGISMAKRLHAFFQFFMFSQMFLHVTRFVCYKRYENCEMLFGTFFKKNVQNAYCNRLN
jgi:hypothetical protein